MQICTDRRVIQNTASYRTPIENAGSYRKPALTECQLTVDQINQKYRLKHWATHQSVRSFLSHPKLETEIGLGIEPWQSMRT